MLMQSKNTLMKPKKVLGYEDMKRMQEKMEELRIQAETGQKKQHLAPQRRADQDQQLTVHIIPHSHQDIGWVKTIDEYYTGSNKGEQMASVKLTLDSVIDELSKDPSRKYT